MSPRPFEDRELPEPDEADDDDLETLPCPACGAQIYEEAERCPSCGEYVTHSTAVLRGRSIAFLLLALLGIAAVIIVLLSPG